MGKLALITRVAIEILLLIYNRVKFDFAENGLEVTGHVFKFEFKNSFILTGKRNDALALCVVRTILHF